MVNKQLSDEDIEYISSIEGIKTLYIPGSDFVGRRGLDRKTAIQYLFIKHYFRKLIKRSEFLDRIDGSRLQALNGLIDKLRLSRNFNSFFNYSVSGLGPGEVMLYFLTNNSSLGGFKTGDLTVGNQHYEIKVSPIPVSKYKGYAADVTLGSTLKLNNVLNGLEELRKELKLDSLSQGNIDIMREKAKDKFNNIEKEFKERVVDYFSGKQIIVMNSGKNNAGLRGKVETIKTVNLDDVMLYRHTRNDFKAYIKL